MNLVTTLREMMAAVAGQLWEWRMNDSLKILPPPPPPPPHTHTHSICTDSGVGRCQTDTCGGATGTYHHTTAADHFTMGLSLSLLTVIAGMYPLFHRVRKPGMVALSSHRLWDSHYSAGHDCSCPLHRECITSLGRLNG